MRLNDSLYFVDTNSCTYPTFSVLVFLIFYSTTCTKKSLPKTTKFLHVSRRCHPINDVLPQVTSYRVLDRSGGRSLLDRISGKQKQKSVKEVAEEVRAAALQVGRRGITYHMYYQFRAGLLRPGPASARPPWRGDSGTAAAVRPRL